MSEWRGDEGEGWRPDPKEVWAAWDESHKELGWLHRRGWQDVRDFAIILVAIAVVVLIGVVIAR